MDETVSATEHSSNRLTAENLARDFGFGSPLTRTCLGELYRAILSERGKAAYADWLELFSRLWASAEKRLIAPLDSLKRKIGIEANGPTLPVLFALQTHYALLIRLLVERFGLRGSEILERPFDWCFEAERPELRRAIDRAAEKMNEYEFELSPDSGASDLLKHLHHSLFPRAIRHPLGEYYTPDWLAEYVLDAIGFDGRKPGRLLDPACGSGTFLMAAIRRIREIRAEMRRAEAAAERSSESILHTILSNVAGIDLNPLAVISARANFLIGVRDLIGEHKQIKIPIRLGDSILEPSEDTFDYVAGNPPWIAWDNLPEDYREATKPMWEKYGLFSLSGNAARHGGGKKDLSMLMLYAAADRHLQSGGRLGFVITQTLFQTKGAGDGFRRFRLGDGDFLKVLRVDDLTAIRPFEEAANWSSVVVLEKGSPTVYPVPYVRWSETPEGKTSYEKHSCTASPIDPERPTSPWLVRPAEDDGRSSPCIVPAAAEYRAYLGANSGGANGVYWVEALEAADGGVRIRNLTQKGKRTVESVEAVVEADLLYPLLRWSDLASCAPLPRFFLLLTQDCERRVGLDEELMKSRFPRTYDYLRRFEDLLVSRAAYRRYQSRGAFYSMYNVGPYTTADHKVVWRRMDKRINAAVVEPIDHPLVGRKPVVPQETCVLVTCPTADEAHYFCAMIGSETAGRLIDSHSVRGGKSFGTPSILDYLPIRRFDCGSAIHRRLAECSREAHRAAKEKRPWEEVRKEIDRLAISSFPRSSVGTHLGDAPASLGTLE
jgi:SAM-dependent methyltransferase